MSITMTLGAAISDTRAFNRFYTSITGLLDEGLLNSRFSLTEARILFELANREGLTATDLAGGLKLDPAYLSRILRKFRAEGLVTAEKSQRDGRERILAMTGEGRSAFAELDTASQGEVRRLLEPLSGPGRVELVYAMKTIEHLLGDGASDREPFVIRSHRPGDIGWIIHRHGALYAEEYGFDESFEVLVARIAGEFLQSHDPDREHCWIAERHGKPVGSVFLVDAGDRLAKLRMLFVEPSARGHGIGRRLVRECLGMAKRAGYTRVTLWTNDILTAARHIYECEGFELVAEEPHHSFGQDLVGQTWERDL